MTKHRALPLICFTALFALGVFLFACVRNGVTEAVTQTPTPANGPEWTSLKAEGRLDLRYATQFAVTAYEDGYKLITIVDSGSYLLVPEGKTAPVGLESDVVILRQPLERIYLAATSAMDLFRALDGVGNIRLSAEKESGWYIDEAKRAMASGEMLYAGKYSAPDYELIYAEKCDLAIESTMIYHSPAVKEQLERLGVPVLVERSSYESDPLGRMEWLKLYGVLLGKESLAEEIFDREVDALSSVIGQENTDKTVAFFYITTTGSVNVRKSGDYVAKMIDMAGGQYIFPDLTENASALSTMNMQMEEFYSRAKDADVLIYNSAIDGELHTMEELLAKSPLFADFKAVKSGNVWCTGKNLFQEPLGLGRLIADFHTVLTEQDPKPEELSYLHRLTN
ncbi:MAG: ABC transporter substrate-binding protein [Oscillospiraceae bacterium]|jgi:iron complex transport system substrate-binding protein